MSFSTRKLWTRDELIIVMNLYTQLNFGQFHARQPLIVSVAGKLGRTPGSIAMKLSNLASFDPVHKERGVSGLRGASKQDAAFWSEFQSNWDEYALESQERFDKLIGPGEVSENPTEFEPRIPDIETDRIASTKVRRGHAFFGTAVKVSYHYTCCITGNLFPELLTASHIVPWKDSKTDRLNPRNGLCLAKTQDAAFDEGLMTLDEDLRVVLSKRIRDHGTLETIRDNFLRYEGRTITLPHRFRPDPQFLAYHRENVFERRCG